jgi:glutamine cyclotransferase
MLYEQMTIKGNNFSSVTWREQVTFQWDNDDIYFVLDQHA